MSFDALEALRDGGTPVEMLSDGHRAILAQLTPAEVALWNSIKDRLDEAGGGEVSGHDLNLLL